MHRKTIVVALLLAVGCLTAYPSASAEPKKKKVFSGCEKGAHLGKVAITVKKKDVGDGCYVSDVIPASVCVAPNGAIRWEVEVEGICDFEGTIPIPALQITEPLPVLLDEPKPETPEPILKDCRFVTVRSQGPNIVFCDIDGNAHTGFYKYGLEGKTGDIEGVDPGIEVRGPRAP